MSNFTDLMELVRLARNFERRPKWQEAWRQAARDGAEHALEDDGSVIDPAFNQLTGKERDDYLDEVFGSLGAWLGWAVMVWVIIRAPVVDEWLEHRRRQEQWRRRESDE